MTSTTPYSQLLQYLKNELALPEASIALAIHKSGKNSNFLPLILWQSGLISLEQLDQTFEWLSNARTCKPTSK
ncbi:Protein of unknown function (DUF2949) [Leptolyngbya sp. PCC 7375]|nr:Protein of unknown function (DUF2949) [Leptolyngbya sp. PCC 7375]